MAVCCGFLCPNPDNIPSSETSRRFRRCFEERGLPKCTLRLHLQRRIRPARLPPALVQTFSMLWDQLCRAARCLFYPMRKRVLPFWSARGQSLPFLSLIGPAHVIEALDEFAKSRPVLRCP
jgi:hypothetical protein